MPESTRRRVRNIIKSGSLNRRRKPEDIDEGFTDEELEGAEAELDNLLGQATSISEAEWDRIAQQGQRRMSG